MRAGTRFSENFNQLLIITALQVFSFHHLFAQAAYPDAVAPGVEAALTEDVAAPGVEAGRLVGAAAPVAAVGRLVVVCAPAGAVEPAPSVAERAAAVVGPAATGESVPVSSFFLFAASAGRSPVAAPPAHFELRAASLAAAFAFVPASRDAVAVQ